MEEQNVDLAQEARDEEHLLAALGKIQDMYMQLRHLRGTVPSLIRPMRNNNTSPEVMYSDFAKAATNAVNETRDFATKMKAQTTQDILLKAKKSKSEEPEGIMTWLATQHADWFNQPVSIGTKARLDDDAFGIDESMNSLSVEEIVEKFKEDHPEADISINTEKEDISYSLPTPASLLFRIQSSVSDSQPTSYVVTCHRLSQPGQQSQLHIAITQSLSERPRKSNLMFTLQLLKSYSDIASRPCVKCNHVLDTFGSLPACRQLDRSETTETFRAIHTGCVKG